jgi:hypothetical protein
VGKGFSVVSKNEQTDFRDFDFDRWMRLAEENMESFEATRVAAIEQLLESFSPENRERMRRLQWRIDQERRLAKSPMGSCLRLSKMMWRQLLGEGGLRERLLDLAGGICSDARAEPEAAKRPTSSAQVLAFSRAAE